MKKVCIGFKLYGALPFSAISGHKGIMLKSTPKQLVEAQLRYLDGDLHVLLPGDYVICAVTAQQIPLAALRYWSVDRQEAYIDASAAVKAEQAALASRESD